MTTCEQLHVGDRVEWTGPGMSVLDLGPGEVVTVEGGSVWVRVLYGGKMRNGDTVKRGERFIFAYPRELGGGLRKVTPDTRARRACGGHP